MPQPGAGTQLLVADDLWLRYPGGDAALRGASIALTAGRCAGLFGNNGAGKSTLARTLSGLQRADRGRVQLGSTTLRPAPPSWLWFAALALGAAALLAAPAQQAVERAAPALRPPLRKLLLRGDAPFYLGCGAALAACLALAAALRLAAAAWLAARAERATRGAVVYITSEDGACFKQLPGRLSLLEAVTGLMGPAVDGPERRRKAHRWLTDAGFQIYDQGGAPRGSMDEWLDDASGVRVEQLSGGQRHLVYVLRNLARPGKQVVILDDVLTYLDQAAQRFVLDLIKELIRAEGWAGLYVSTELSHIARVAGDWYFMDGGQVHECGTDLAHLRYPPAARYAREYAQLMTGMGQKK